MPNEQQMLHKEQPQQEQEEERKFGGSGGGKPFIAFGGSSRSSQTVCRPDPNNPGQQICKRIEKESYRDPFTGEQRSRTNESDEYRPGGFFGGSADP